MSGATKKIRRGIMSALAPMSGSLATGNVQASALVGQGSITIPKNSHLVPIYKSTTNRKEISWDRPMYTTADTLVVEAGTPVPVSSVTGGLRMNLPVGTELRFDPILTGVTTIATVTGAPLAGGADPIDGPGFAREILAFESLESLEKAQDLFAAEVGDTPAIVVAYAGASTGERTGDGRYWRANNWRLYVITRWGGPIEAIGNEATDIMDRIEELLVDRSSSHGMVWSTPGGEVLGRTRVRIQPGAILWAIDYRTWNGIQRQDMRVDGVDYADWLRTRFGLQTAVPLPLPILTDALYPAGQIEFSTSFDADAFHS